MTGWLRVVVVVWFGLVAACARGEHRESPDGRAASTSDEPSSEELAAVVARVQSTFTLPQTSGERRPALGPAVEGPTTLDVTYADGVATQMASWRSGLSVSAQLVGARPVKAERTGGYVVYRDALGPGSHVIHRPTESGVEDFALLPEGNRASSLSYDLHLGSGIAGLRQAGNVVELLDATGTPRIRATAPYVVDSAKTVRQASLAVTGCAVDTSMAPPWGRLVTPPGTSTCRLSVNWDARGLKAPLLVDPAWSATSSMTYGRREAAATVLANGDVLVVGGTSADGLLAYQPVAELYNATLGAWSVTGATHSAHVSPVADTFGSGDALVFGGSLSLLGDALCLLEHREECAHDAETYSAATGEWSVDRSSSLLPLDAGMTSTALSDGSILVVGGINVPTRCTRYRSNGNPVACAKPPQGFFDHTATRLADGRVLFAGGLGLRGPNRTAYLYDPTKNGWSTTGATISERVEGVATKLGDGRVLMTGGGLGSAEAYSPSTGKWSALPSMSTPRLGATITTLASGRALVAGGMGVHEAILATTEEFDPTANAWSPPSTLGIARTGHVAALLGGGQVLVATGRAPGSDHLASAELYASGSAPPPPPPNCDDGNGCTLDSANPDGTCSHAPVANGTSCSDSDACTRSDTCQSGICAGGSPVTCAPADACHVAGACDPTSGACSNPAAPDGTACSDGSACTLQDTCSAGSCVGTSPVTCVPTDACHVAGSCDPGSGACSNPAAPDGTSCSDGNSCTEVDACSAGACVGGSPKTCSVSDGCHLAGTCDPTSGTCSNPPAPDGTTCSDGNSCTVGDSCQAGACAAGTPLTCSGKDACHAAGSCVPETGTCSPPAPTNGPGCNDAGGSGGVDAGSDAGSDAGVGCASVDDDNPCTTDTCDAVTRSPMHTPIAGCGVPVADVENAFETRASILGRAVTDTGAPVTDLTATVYDGTATGSARTDVQMTGSNGGFRIRLASFPQATPFSATNAQRELVRLTSASTLPVLREAYVRPGDALDLGIIVMATRDAQVTTIGPGGGTATDSRGLVEVEIPAGAVSAPIPVVITPHITRESVPFPLPDGTLTTYAMTLEPEGQTFAVPVTVRLTNTRSLPTTLAIPVGYVDEVKGRWLDDGVALWDGTKFAYTTSHFSTHDVNSSDDGEWLYALADGRNPGNASMSCNMGSSVGVANGSLGQSISLPMVQRSGASYGVTLTYNSGLAGGFGSGSTQGTTTSGAVTVAQANAVMQGTKVSATCMPRAAADAAAASSPGSCAGGSCSPGSAGSMVAVTYGIAALGSMQSHDDPSAAGMAAGTFVPTIPVPDADNSSAAAASYARITMTLQAVGIGGGCAANKGGGEVGPSTFFGSGTGPGVQVGATSATGTTDAGPGGSGTPGDAGGGASAGTSGPEGPLVTYTRSTFMRTLSASPAGSGWGIAGVDQLYKSPWGDQAVIIGGDGGEEDFLTDVKRNLVGNGQVLTRDPQTGEILGISPTGQVSIVDPATGSSTAVSSVTVDSAPRAFGIAYVGSVRHFEVFTNAGLFDFDGSGARRLIYAVTAPTFDPFFWSGEPAVVAQGSVLYFIAGRGDDIALRTVDLALDGATQSDLSNPVSGMGSLTPTMPLGSFTFGDPHGLAWVDGVGLYVADRQRDSVYLVHPSTGGTLTTESTLDRVAGSGSSRFTPPVGERSPALQFPLNQPSGLSYVDGVLWIASPFAIGAYDVSSGDMRWVVIDDTLPQSQATTSLFSLYNSAVPTSLLGLSATVPMWSDGFTLETFTTGSLVSERDPTRAVAVDANGATVTDTTRDVTERFDAFGRLVEVRTRPGDLVNSYGYDGQTLRVTTIADPSGSATTFTYDGSHRLSAITDAAGRTTHLDNDGTLRGIVLPDGEAWSFAYDARGRMTQKTSPRGDSTTYDFDDNGLTATHKPATGDTYLINSADSQANAYDATGEPTISGSYTDPRGVTHSLVYNVYGEAVAESYVADGQSYSIVQNIPQYVDNGVGTGVTTLNARMQRVASTTINGLLVTPIASYDPLGRLISSYNQSSFFGTAYVYDVDGRISQLRPGYVNDGFYIDRDPAGRYAGMHEVYLQTGQADGASIALTRNGPNGQVDTLTQHGLTTTFHFDASGNATSATDTLDRTSTFKRDAAGQVIASSDGAVAWSFARDLANRVTSATDAAGGSTTFSYLQPGCGCSEGAEVASVHTPDLPAGAAYSFTYGPEGRLAATTDPDGNTTALGYEPMGELKQVLDALHRSTIVGHDSLGRVASSLDPLGRSSSSAYAYPTSSGYINADITARGPSSAPVSLDPNATLPDGALQLGTRTYTNFREPLISFYRDATQAISFGHAWDGFNRLNLTADRSDISYSSDTPYSAGALFNESVDFDNTLPSDPPFAIESTVPGGFQDAEFGYDADRYLTSASGWAGSTTYMEWDTLGNDTAGRPTTMVGKFFANPGFPVPSAAFTYAPGLNQLSTVTDASGTRSFTYDSRGNVSTLAASEGTYTLAYDAVGRNTKVTYPDGHTRTQTFDHEGRLLLRCYGGYGGGLPDRCYGATYDAVGNPTQLTDPEGTSALAYDALDRLTSVSRGGVTESYSYNALGGLHENASTATGVQLDDQRPRLDGSGKASSGVPATLNAQPVTVDAVGRVVSLAGASFVYDVRGKVFTVTRSDGSTETYGYDPWMRRVARMQSDNATYGANEYDVYVGNNIGATIDETGTPQRTWLFEGTDAPLRMTTLGVVTYYELDTTGNVRRLRASGGADLGGYRYSAFGVAYPEDGGTPAPTVDQPLRWKGRPYLEVAGGVYDMRARWWSPRLGAFLSADAFGYFDSSSTLWGWGNQNPTKWSDPSGHCPACVGAAVGAVAGLGYGLLNADYNASAASIAGELAFATASGAYLGSGVGEVVAAIGGGAAILGSLLADESGQIGSGNPEVQAAQQAAEGAVCSVGSRPLQASDLGLSGNGINNLVGSVTNAGTTRIIDVGNISASTNSLLPELRGALPSILASAEADGIQTLQISASFANPALQNFASSQAEQYGGIYTSVNGQETLTFTLGRP